ncbi:MAG TPA: hypothetical protein VJP85_04165 [Candidatus Baltobacteraceae bacterium]|nr:hypothetical protein [Candidatus Baltobacteraceae bacterium]
MTQVREKRFVACPFSAALELAEKAAQQRTGLYLTPLPPLGERASFAVASAPDSTDEVRKHDALLIAWRPQTPGVFPDFHGVLTVRPSHAGVTLQLDGAYAPPYGTLGKMFDFVAGRAIARRTLRHLLDDFAHDIETEYRDERVSARS